MELPFELLRHVALAAAAALLGATLTSLFAARRAARAKLHAAAELKLQHVLESADLRETGRYLDDVVGKFSLREYVLDPEVTRTIDAYVARLEAFVGTNTGVVAQAAEAQRPAERPQLPVLAPELQKALNTLRLGEPWNALVRVRRHIETSLRRKAEDLDISSDRPLSAGQLVALLSQRQRLPRHAQESLRYAIAVCNKAIHGLDVGVQEAEEALFQAAAGLHVLEGAPSQ